MDLFAIFNIETFSVCCASVTVGFSGLVVLTGALFPMMLRSQFMRLIFAISVCDFLGSILLTAGFPSNGPLCEAQGFLWYFFSHGSWFLTAALSIQLYSLLTRNRMLISELWMHAVCWVSNIILSFFIFSGATYGVYDDDALSSEWCQISSSNFTLLEDYTIAVFVAPMIITTSILLIVSLASLLQFYVFRSIPRTDQHKELLRVMLLYPTCMIVAWLPNMVTYFFSLQYRADDDSFSKQLTYFVIGLSDGWGALYGTFLAIVFFANSNEARRRWKTLLFGQAAERISVFNMSQRYTTEQIVTDPDIFIFNATLADIKSVIEDYPIPRDGSIVGMAPAQQMSVDIPHRSTFSIENNPLF